MQYNGKEYKVLNEKQEGNILHLALQEIEKEKVAEIKAQSTKFVFGERSNNNLKNAHPDLQKLANKVLSYSEIDFVVICAYRNEKEQNEAYRTGMSGLKYPKSNHNKIPSLAIDVMPYPIPKDDKLWDKEPYKTKVKQLADLFTRASKDLNIGIARGIDWKKPYDPPHIELV